MPPITDADLRALLHRDPDRGWRAFVEQHTPAILASLERLGLRDRDEVMDLYVSVCERLAAGDCERLKQRDPRQGSMAAWLGVVVRNAAVDWVRSRAGRRRIFGVVADMSAFHQQVFQQFYWGESTPSAIAESLTTMMGRPVTLFETLGALDEIHERLTARHYAELAALAARSKPAASLEAEMDERGFDARDPAPLPDARLSGIDRESAMEHALTTLPAEDAAIVRLHYLQGLSLPQVRRALHLSTLTRDRLASIVASLRTKLAPTMTITPLASASGDRT